MAVSSLPTGGYDCDFVDAVPDHLFCSICLLPPRKPHLVNCCGAKYCESCINVIEAAGNPCPLCKQKFQSMIDKSFERIVLDLKIRCSRKSNGCNWTGELRYQSRHERDDCVLALVECRYACGERIPRHLLDEHELEKCPLRPLDIKLEALTKRIEERHNRELAAMREEFRKALIEERTSHRKEMERRLAIQKREIKV